MTDKWGSPEWVIDAAREIMGSIDLDPCSSARFNERVKAAKFYTEADNGLEQPWHGNVFLNPPNGRGVPLAFYKKALREIRAGNVQCVFYVGFNISHLRVLRSGDDLMVNHPIAIPLSRICFESEDGERGESPRHDNFFSILTDDAKRIECFSNTMHYCEIPVLVPEELRTIQQW